MNLLLLDTETTGVDDGAVCVEVACALYSVEHAAVLRSFSSLMHATANPARDVNRIPDALLHEAGPAAAAWTHVAEMIDEASAIVAHNADFDRRFVPVSVMRERAIPWICSMNDLEWPRSSSSKSLVAIALAHDLGVSHAHRAAVDVDLLGRLFTRAKELGASLETMIARGLRPKALFQALVSFERKDEAKAAGFQWDGAKRQWTRSMAIEDAAALPFPTRRL